MKKKSYATRPLLLSLLLPLLSASALAAPTGTLSAVAPGTLSMANAAADIDGERMLRHIRVLASDRYEGRALGGNGERLTLDYLQRQLIRFGVGPGKADGGYLQSVPLLAVASRPSLSFSTGARSSELAFPLDYLAWSQRGASQVVLQGSEMLFVGYGVTAPAYHWDDYQGIDVRGKTLLMLGGAPALFGVAGSGAATPGGYGSASYKFALAHKLGAVGALIVPANGTAGMPSYDGLRQSVMREQFSLRDDADAADLPALSGWLRPERAQDIARSVGYDFENLKKSALSRDFKPVVLGVAASATVENRWRNLESYNVVAKIDGTDPVLKNEVVIYSANWDQYGIDVAESGAAASGTGVTPQLYRGARNNGSGVAALLEVARAYRALRRAPKRSVLFVLTTGGGERGALGARHYAAHPLYPLSKTILNINIDGLNLWGRTRDVALVSAGTSHAGRAAARIAQRQGRVLRPQTAAQSGVLYRGDQSAFAAANVPVLMLGPGRDFVNKRSAAKRDQAERALGAGATGYHRTGDVVQPGWDMSGAAEDAELLFKVGYEVAQGK